MGPTSRKHALIIVDLQKDFLPGGALAVPDGDKVVPVIREVLEENPWDCIVMTQDWHPAGHVSFARNHEGRHVLDVIELPYGMQMLWPVHCVEGTDGAAIEGVDTMKADKGQGTRHRQLLRPLCGRQRDEDGAGGVSARARHH